MKILSNNTYLLLIDEEAEIKGTTCLCYNSIKNTWNDDVILYQGAMPEYHYNGFQKIIAYYPLSKEAKELDLPELPNPFEEVDIEKLAKDRYGKYETSIDIPNKYLREGFIDGYKAAQSKQFSLEDMIAFGKKCFYKGFDKSENDDANSFTAWREECSKLIQSLSTQQLPVSFEPEYEITYKEYKNGKKELISVEFHKITNSEGKEVLVGTYKY